MNNSVCVRARVLAAQVCRSAARRLSQGRGAAGAGGGGREGGGCVRLPPSFLRLDILVTKASSLKICQKIAPCPLTLLLRRREADDGEAGVGGLSCKSLLGQLRAAELRHASVPLDINCSLAKPSYSLPIQAQRVNSVKEGKGRERGKRKWLTNKNLWENKHQSLEFQ